MPAWAGVSAFGATWQPQIKVALGLGSPSLRVFKIRRDGAWAEAQVHCRSATNRPKPTRSLLWGVARRHADRKCVVDARKRLASGAISLERLANRLGARTRPEGKIVAFHHRRTNR